MQIIDENREVLGYENWRYSGGSKRGRGGRAAAFSPL